MAATLDLPKFHAAFTRLGSPRFVIIPDSRHGVQHQKPVVVAVVLAAGESRRFGDQNKLLLEIDGEALVHRAARIHAEAGLSRVFVIVGHERTAIESSISDLPVRVLANPDYAAGMSTSIVRGVRELGKEVDAVVIGVADQPLLHPETVEQVLSRYRETRAPIVAARYAGQRATPVLFHRSLFPELTKLTGDRGASSVVDLHADSVSWVDVEDLTRGLDIDSPADFAALRRGTPRSTRP